MRLADYLPEAWRARWQHWLDRRLPPSSRLQLSQRTIFIFPTRRGLGLGFVILLLLLVATNYENSLVFAVGFWLLGMALVSIFHTYANLSGLSLGAVQARPVFAGQEALVEIALGGQGRERPGIVLGWPGGSEQRVQVPASGEVVVGLPLPAPTRGILRPGRLRIGSTFPMGWLWAWSWPDLDVELLVYPHPQPGPWPEQAGEGESGRLQRPGGQDFAGYSHYQPGDSPRDVAWRAYARGMPLQTRRYATAEQRQHLLRWQDFEGLSTEQRLSRMCWLALELARQEHAFGLELPGVSVEAGAGEAHLHRVLSALAMFRS